MNALSWLSRILSAIPRWLLKNKGGAVPDDDIAGTLKRRNDINKWAKGGTPSIPKDKQDVK